MAIEIRPSSGQRLTRSDKVELDMDILQAAKESEESGEAREAVFATEKEAKATSTKLRSHLNSTDRGLRATVVEESGVWVLEFKVSSTKRDVSKKS